MKTFPKARRKKIEAENNRIIPGFVPRLLSGSCCSPEQGELPLPNAESNRMLFLSSLGLFSFLGCWNKTLYKFWHWKGFLLPCWPSDLAQGINHRYKTHGLIFPVDFSLWKAVQDEFWEWLALGVVFSLSFFFLGRHSLCQGCSVSTRHLIFWGQRLLPHSLRAKSL